MARYTGPRCRKCRQLGFSVCGSVRCALIRRESPPGMHRPRGKVSDFKKQLLEKQKLRHTYWVPERQFRNHVRRAFRQKGSSGENLLQLLERRLDNMVYRLGFAPTRPAAQQLVVHGHVMVNGKKVDRPSYPVGVGETISIKEGSRDMQTVREGLIRARSRPTLPYVELDQERMQGRLTGVPSRAEIPLPIDESLVVEYYAGRM